MIKVYKLESLFINKSIYDYTGNKDTNIYINPDMMEFLQCVKNYGEVKGIVDNKTKDLYIWDTTVNHGYVFDLDVFKEINDFTFITISTKPFIINILLEESLKRKEDEIRNKVDTNPNLNDLLGNFEIKFEYFS